MMAAGLALRAWSMRTLGAYYSRTLRTTSDQQMVQSGPHHVIRHPGYLGSIMVRASLAVTSGEQRRRRGDGLDGHAYGRRIAAEEAMLAGRFGSAYAEYSQRTKRLIPLIW
jgi:protein-S-isoprenylcysteine O-methyltransferase Ste14